MTTRTTFHLAISRPALAVARVRSWLYQRDPILLIAPIALATLIGLVLGVQLWRVLRPAGHTETIISTQAPILIMQTARAVALPTPALAPTAAPRLIIAYDQPNGSAFPDPIPEPQPSSWIARWGDSWIEVAWQPNPVWIRIADLGANLADVRPMPQVQIAPVVSALAPAPSYQVESAPPADADQAGPGEPAYRASLGLTDADMLAALDEHNAREHAWCAAHPENVNCIAVAKLAATATAQAAQP